LVTPSDLQDKTKDFLTHTTARRANQVPRPKDEDEIPQHLLLPAKGNPKMWVVHIKAHIHIGSLL
jgi:hypothetical protein